MSFLDTLIEEAEKDGTALVRMVVAAFGDDGHEKVQAILDAEKAASRTMVDLLEKEAIDKETTP